MLMSILFFFCIVSWLYFSVFFCLAFLLLSTCDFYQIPTCFEYGHMYNLFYFSNSDHPMRSLSIIASSHHIYMGVILHAHLVCGESHILLELVRGSNEGL